MMCNAIVGIAGRFPSALGAAPPRRKKPWDRPAFLAILKALEPLASFSLE